MSPRVGQCCCCCSLRTGCLVIGYFDLIGAIILIIVISVTMAETAVDGRSALISPALGAAAISHNIVEVVFASLLLVGVYKKKPRLVKAYWMYLVLSVVMNMVRLSCDEKYRDQVAILVVCIVIGASVTLYFAVCVRSYHLELKEERRGFQQYFQPAMETDAYA